VTKDVPDFALIIGNPGRVAGWMCACGNRIVFTDDHETGKCQACRRIYRKTGNEVILNDQRSIAGSQTQYSANQSKTGVN
jgi:UDP-2-acetamido-3-amino-2,3-dideoxy-glucuronate N-acetyltransferase